MATAAGRNAAGLGHSPPDTAEDTSGWESPVAICQCCHHCPQGAIMFLSALLGVPRRQGFEHQPTQICWCPCNMLCLDGPDIANKNTGCPVKFYFFKGRLIFNFLETRFLFFNLIWPCHKVDRMLVPWPGIKPGNTVLTTELSYKSPQLNFNFRSTASKFLV